MGGAPPLPSSRVSELRGPGSPTANPVNTLLTRSGSAQHAKLHLCTKLRSARRSARPFKRRQPGMPHLPRLRRAKARLLPRRERNSASLSTQANASTSRNVPKDLYTAAISLSLTGLSAVARGVGASTTRTGSDRQHQHLLMHTSPGILRLKSPRVILTWSADTKMKVPLPPI